MRIGLLQHARIATRLLTNGVRPKVASERLGQTKFSICWTSSHVIPGMQQDTAAAVGEAVRKAIQTCQEKLGGNPEQGGRIGGTESE
jgi:hypothetical protein